MKIQHKMLSTTRLREAAVYAIAEHVVNQLEWDAGKGKYYFPYESTLTVHKCVAELAAKELDIELASTAQRADSTIVEDLTEAIRSGVRCTHSVGETEGAQDICADKTDFTDDIELYKKIMCVVKMLDGHTVSEAFDFLNLVQGVIKQGTLLDVQSMVFSKMINEDFEPIAALLHEFLQAKPDCY